MHKQKMNSKENHHNESDQRNVAVILAGGSGHRVGGDVPKQLLKIGGRTVLERSIDAFEACPRIDEIAVVVRQDMLIEISNIIESNNYQKVSRLLIGGKERSDSSLSAIRAYSDNCRLIFHDAARPLVSQDVISRCIAALDHYRAVGTAIAATDTILQVTDNGLLQSIPQRSTLRQAQTPQAFHASVIRQAYKLAQQDEHFQATDDCGVVARYLPNEPIMIVEGDTRNIKITYPTDIAIAELMLKREEQ